MLQRITYKRRRDTAAWTDFQLPQAAVLFTPEGIWPVSEHR